MKTIRDPRSTSQVDLKVRVARVVAFTGFGLGAAVWALVVIYDGTIANDALVYWAGAHALVTGTDPWTAANGIWHFAGLPPTVVLFAPAGLLPAPVFLAVWMTATVAAAVWIVRHLSLAWGWLAYPPLVMAVLLGNPIVISMALILGGHGVVGVLVRPQHALVVLVRSPRALLTLAAIGVLSLLIVPSWFGQASAISARYAVESGPSVNAWGSWWILPAAVAIVAIARGDMVTAAWLTPAVLFPFAGWYSAIALLVTRSPLIALLGGIPLVPGAVPVAAAVLAVGRIVSSRAGELEYVDDRLGEEAMPPTSGAQGNAR